MIKRLLLLSIVLSIIASSSCQMSDGADSSDISSTEPITGQSAADTTDSYSERRAVKDGLPEKDFGGYEFNIYLRSEEGYNEDFVAEEVSGEIINDAVYNRNRAVEERFNVKIGYKYDDSGNTTYKTTAVQSILAGEDVNDVLALHGAFAFNYAKEGYLLDWNANLPYVDLDQPWWDKDFADNLNIGGKLFAMTGDISHLSIGGTFCLFFNKDLFKNYDIDYPYQDVRDGKWTLDKFAQICKDGSKDLNGDNAITPDYDLYGLTTGSWSYPVAMFYMAGDRVISINENGAPSLTVYSERTNDIIDRFLSLYNTSNIYVSDYSPQYDGDIFLNGRAMFTGATLNSIIKIRSSDIDIGIIPCPKYDESTPKYNSLVDAGMNVFSIPITAQDPERTSIILEALCAEGYREVVPTYYEVALKVKYSRDDESADMLEIIRDGRFFDYGYYDASINWDLSYIGRNVLLNGGNFASYHEQREKGAISELEKLYVKYKDE